MAAWQEVHDGWRRRQQAAAAPGAQPAAAKDAAGAPPPPLLLASDGHLKPATKLLWADPKAKALAAMPRELLRALHASAARESWQAKVWAGPTPGIISANAQSTLTAI